MHRTRCVCNLHREENEVYVVDIAYQTYCHVVFADTDISAAGMEHLRHLTALEALNLGHTDASDLGCQHLGKLTRLTSLCLDCAKVGDAGLRQLSALTRLQVSQLCVVFCAC